MARNHDLIPGQQICTSCRKKIISKETKLVDDKCVDDDDFKPEESTVNDFNKPRMFPIKKS